MLFVGAVQQVCLLLLRTLFGLRLQVLFYLFAVQRGPRDVCIVVGRFAAHPHRPQIAGNYVLCRYLRGSAFVRFKLQLFRRRRDFPTFTTS